MYHYTPHLIAITHLFVLGFICSIVMGAMYQLVPVTLETQLFSERLVKWQFAAHVIGFVGMVFAFWNFNMALVGAFGSLLTLGVGLFVFNLLCTLAKVKGWNAIKFGIASALFWLSSTVAAGLFLAASKCWSFISFQPLAAMHAHAHLGVVGVFVMMIVTVSYKLVPMFTLSELQNERRAWWSVALLNLGLLGVFVDRPVAKPFEAGVCLGDDCRLRALRLGNHGDFARPQPPFAGLGDEIFSHGHRAAGSVVHFGARAVVVAAAGDRVHDAVGKCLWPARAGRTRGAGDSGNALQNRAVPRLVSQLQPSHRPRQSAGAGGDVFRAAPNRGLLELSGRTRCFVRGDGFVK